MKNTAFKGTVTGRLSSKTANQSSEPKSYRRHINDLTPKERAVIDKKNAALMAKRGRPRPKTIIKYASDAERGLVETVPVRRPKIRREEPTKSRAQFSSPWAGREAVSAAKSLMAKKRRT
jgi:hypothetical protein